MPKVRHWIAIPIGLLAAALVLGMVAAHTSALSPHELPIDRHIQTSLRTPWLDRVVVDFSNLATPLVGLLITLALTGWLLAVRRDRAGALATLLVIAVGWNSVELVKNIVARHRPPTEYSLSPEIASDSFPSGHTAFALSLAVAVYFLVRGTRWERTAVVVGAVWVALIAFSRLYIGAHYPTDLLGSLLVSSAAIIVLTGLWDKAIHWRERVGAV